MRYFEDRSEAEISVSLDRPIGTVKSDIHRALRRLRERIEPEDPMTRERGVHGAR
jgi:DNA-directed RNA polymerase specialized sigma24 family protein